MTSHPTIIEPDEPPPSYSAATAPPATSNTSLRVRNGIPPSYRRSMEDEGRPLPSGWIRQYDPENHHQFFVDTNSDPPRSIWHHPYDDSEYLSSLSPAERQKIQSSLRVPSNADIAAESSEDDREHDHDHDHPLPPRPEQPEKKGFGRKMKDKLTGTTHEQRLEQRRQRAIAEEQAYERHRQLRQAMVTAINTGQPQFVGKDRDGRDLYIEPPQHHNMQYGGYGYNPYTHGPYASPNSRFMRPVGPYGRPYGRGYGGGMGLPLAGGLMGGILLGGIIGSGF
ncbi:MAG: hypothetical protein Q9166_005241 [cf. Caloplaca sp. 2 TL-2023]